MSNTDGVSKSLTDWLEQQGYALEMLVARAFRQRDFRVSISDFFKDFETGESREIDVIAQQISDIKRPVVMQVCFTIECKVSKDKPWVLFISDPQPEQFLPFNVIASRIALHFIIEALGSRHPENWKRLLENPIFHPRYVGHGIKQAFSQTDVAYKAVMSSVKAAVARAVSYDTLPQRHENYYCCIVFPVIVIEGNLFECHLSADGKLTTREVDSGVLYWKSDNPTRALPYVHIYTKSSLDQLARYSDDAAKSWLDIAGQLMTDLTRIAREVSLDPQP